jgi:hypothetical protein
MRYEVDRVITAHCAAATSAYRLMPRLCAGYRRRIIGRSQSARAHSRMAERHCWRVLAVCCSTLRYSIDTGRVTGRRSGPVAPDRGTHRKDTHGTELGLTAATSAPGLEPDRGTARTRCWHRSLRLAAVPTKGWATRCRARRVPVRTVKGQCRCETTFALHSPRSSSAESPLPSRCSSSSHKWCVPSVVHRANAVTRG